MHDKLDEEEKQLLSDLQEARKHVKKTGDVIVEEMILARIESLQSVQMKLVDKGSLYDYVTVADSIKSDVDNQYDEHLAGLKWNNKRIGKGTSGKVNAMQPEEKYHQCSVESEQSEEKIKTKMMKEVGKIRPHNQIHPIAVCRFTRTTFILYIHVSKV